MKKVLAVAFLISAVSATTAFALTFNQPGATNVPQAGVVASKHNMNLYLETAKDTEGRVCAFCHTPHHAILDNTATYLPLWSHNLTTQRTFNPYVSDTLNATIVDPLSGPSLLCMSCHDGVIAVDQHYGGPNTGAKLADDIFNGTAVGLKNAAGETELANDHPIGFVYADARTDEGANSGLKDPVSILANGKSINDQLTAGVMTCATCHDVHNKDNVAQKGASNYFLMGNQDGSAFCLGCHIK
jgi:Zn-finger protein